MNTFQAKAHLKQYTRIADSLEGIEIALQELTSDRVLDRIIVALSRVS